MNQNSKKSGMGQNDIIEIADDVFFVDTEPGDATHYSFLVYLDGPNNFIFAPRRNTFKYPQRICYWDVENINEAGIRKIAEEYSCNFHTVRECIRVLKQIRG